MRLLAGLLRDLLAMGAAVADIRHGGRRLIADIVSTDAELIAACDEFLRIQDAFTAAYAAGGFKNMEPDDPAHDLLDPIPELSEKIVALHAVTADGFLARARCAAFFYLPQHSSCQDDPETGDDDRFMAAILRDAVRLNREKAR